MNLILRLYTATKISVRNTSSASFKSFFYFYFQDFHLGSYIKLFHFHNF